MTVCDNHGLEIREAGKKGCRFDLNMAAVHLLYSLNTSTLHSAIPR